jgi:predicted Zn-dependent peptidase
MPNDDAPKIEYVKYTLDNGLKVILHKDNSTPIVAVSVLYHVGSKNEDPDRTGFAHFFEHLMFEGSKNIERGQMDKMIAAAGGTYNANTSNDRTFYYEILPSNQLKLGLWIESERMLHAIVDTLGVETQRAVVKEEKRLRVDNQPYGSILEETLKRAYTKHPYRWAPIGSMEHLDAASFEDFTRFYETFYVPNNATLSIAGDIDIEETKKMIDGYFTEIPRGTVEIPRPTIKEPKQTEEVRDIVYDNIQLPAVIQAYKMPPQGTHDAYAFEVLSTLLTGGASARMQKQLVDQDQKAVAVAAIPLSLEDGGLFINYGIANMGIEAEDLEAGMDAVIKTVQNELIPEKEFQKVMNQIEASFVSTNSRIASIAESLANYEVYYGDAELINTVIDKYRKVTREDLKRVASEYLIPQNRVVLYYLPKSAQPESSESQGDE